MAKRRRHTPEPIIAKLRKAAAFDRLTGAAGLRLDL